MLSYLTGMLGVAALAAAWVAIQIAWGRSFPGDESEPDVLARRRDCSGCSHLGACAPRLSTEEDLR